ncbi:beta-ketoacyl synthase N-terminal-like domain-containing protein [Fontimonas sp. SYSU GA230001]|uniref:beta-ketoacyl synthase N-terminal-like domain-containing protein n=1 Tax=Fontimonas sp. SYSU GA230001 TaxID=3142450 RepID=UPI0032B4E651
MAPGARPVYLRAGDVLCAAGRGAAAAAEACLQQSTHPARIEFSSLGVPVQLPYFRIDGARGAPDADLLRLARDVIDAAQIDDARRRRMGLFLGTSSGGIAQHEHDYAEAVARDPDALAIFNPDQSRSATRLYSALGLQGPNFTLSTACSSAANALLYATWAVREGHVDDALVVGIEFENRVSQQGFHSLLLATRELSRPFDLRRDGIMLGEGAAVAVISRDPPRRGPVWRLRGGGTFCDTTHPTNPSAAQIAHTIRLALTDAGVAAEQIGAIKAHGTGTRANDLSEGLGLREVFGERVPPFTTIKPVLGHTLGACGLLETLAFAACLDRGRIPATRHFEQPDPEIGIAPLTAPAPWTGGPVLLNTFGFGGNNCALVLERDGC